MVHASAPTWDEVEGRGWVLGVTHLHASNLLRARVLYPYCSRLSSHLFILPSHLSPTLSYHLSLSSHFRFSFLHPSPRFPLLAHLLFFFFSSQTCTPCFCLASGSPQCFLLHVLALCLPSGSPLSLHSSIVSSLLIFSSLSFRFPSVISLIFLQCMCLSYYVHSLFRVI